MPGREGRGGGGASVPDPRHGLKKTLGLISTSNKPPTFSESRSLPSFGSPRIKAVPKCFFTESRMVQDTFDRLLKSAALASGVDPEVMPVTNQSLREAPFILHDNLGINEDESAKIAGYFLT